MRYPHEMIPVMVARPGMTVITGFGRRPRRVVGVSRRFDDEGRLSAVRLDLARFGVRVGYCEMTPDREVARVFTRRMLAAGRKAAK